jgi:hypothetical protein
MRSIPQMGNPPDRVAITIPTNAGTGTRLADLLAAAGYLGPAPLAIILDAKQPNSASDRAAVVLASPRRGAAIAAADFTTNGQYVAAGVSHYLASDQDAQSYARSADGNTVSALAIVLT